MSLKVLVLEDDAQQRRDIQNTLESELRAKVDTIRSESEFRDDFEKVAKDPPDLAILDVMVRWTKASRELAVIPEFAKHPEIAGLRCAEMLRSDARTSNVQVILYSVLPEEDLKRTGIPDGVVSIVKETDFEGLLGKIRELAPQ